MAETSDLVPNLEEIMEEYVQPEEETRQEEPMEEMPTEAPEAPAVSEERTDKRKGKAREEEVEDFVSEEAYSNWKKHYANKGFVLERIFRNPITPFKEMIEQRGWEAFCAHQKSGYKSSGERILFKSGRQERQHCVRQRSVGTIWSQGH